VDDILKIKIVRDIDKISQSIGSSFYLSTKVNNLKASFPKKYLNLLELVKNHYLNNVAHQTLFSKAIKSSKKFNISDLNKLDIDFLEEISQFSNINIVNSPLFYEFTIQNSELVSRTSTVDQIVRIDTKEYIRKNQNDLFYIYIIDRVSAIWKQRKNSKELVRFNRKLKLENLKKIEIEL